MSTTPRTDALAARDFVPDGLWIALGRELERENAKLLAANAELITVGAELSATADELRAENAELREALNFRPDSMRAAIDAAMEGDK